MRLTWEEFNNLPQTEIQCDIHCVTRWSRFDNRFEGVLFTEVMKLVTPKPEARFAMLRGEHGYTTNLPLEDLMKPTTIFAFQHDGEELSADHGYPLRLVVPHLYLWKSVKWVSRLRAHRRGRARLLGTERLPHVRRPVERTEV